MQQLIQIKQMLVLALPCAAPGFQFFNREFS